MRSRAAAVAVELFECNAVVVVVVVVVIDVIDFVVDHWQFPLRVELRRDSSVYRCRSAQRMLILSNQ